MDYEKKYNEALKRAKKQRADYQKELDKTDKESQLAGLLCAGISALDMAFPELKENDDERIYNEIMNLVKDGGCITSKKDRELAIAYLEKQKDASKAIDAVERIDKYIDDHLANAHDMKDSNPDKKYYRGWDDALGKMSGILQDVYSGEKKKENADSFANEQKVPDCCLKCNEYEIGYKAGYEHGCTAGYNKAMKEVDEQKENPKNAISIPADCATNAKCPYKIHGDEDFIGDIKDTPAYHFGFDEGVRSEREKQKEHSMSAEEVLTRAGLKPYKDGNKWCILAGENIQEGICGFGDTIDEALYQFLLEVIEKQKEIPLMNGDADLYFDNWIQHNDTTKRGCFEEGIRYAQRLQKEQKSAVNEKAEMTDFEQSVYDLCPVLGIDEAKATASDLLELAKKTLLKTGKVVLASNYPEGCSFEDGFHLGYNEGFNTKQKEQKPVSGARKMKKHLKEQ